MRRICASALPVLCALRGLWLLSPPCCKGKPKPNPRNNFIFRAASDGQNCHHFHSHCVNNLVFQPGVSLFCCLFFCLGFFFKVSKSGFHIKNAAEVKLGCFGWARFYFASQWLCPFLNGFCSSLSQIWGTSVGICEELSIFCSLEFNFIQCGQDWDRT